MDKPLRFISLGGDCQPGEQIRRYSGPQAIPFVFDWLECTMDALTSLIESNFANFFRPENLIWEHHPDHWTVTDAATSVVSLHHFVSQDPEHIEQVCLMFALLGRRFMALLNSDTPTVFVRRWIALDGPNGDRRAKRLHDDLCQRKPDCVMLYLQEHDPRPPFVTGNFMSVFNPSTSLSAKWTGYIPIYQRNFARAAKLYQANNGTASRSLERA